MPLAGLDRDRKPVGRRRQGADPARVIRARRVVGEVEVEHQPPVLAAEIGTLDRVEQVSPGPIGLLGAGGVGERQEDPTAVAFEPVELQIQALAAKLEAGDGEALEGVGAIAARPIS